MDIRNPKKIILLLICLTVIIIGGKNATHEASVQRRQPSEIRITTSFYPIYVMALNLTQNIPGVKLTNLAPLATGCLHDVQLTPSDLLVLEESNILIINGLGMEGYMTKVAELLPNLTIINSNQNSNQDRKEANPHTWVSVTLAMEQVTRIGEQLAQYDPVHAEQYRKNTEDYLAELRNLKIKIHQGLAGIKSRELVTFHNDFFHFAEEFDLDILAVIEGEEGAGLNAKAFGQTIETIKENEIKAIFIEEPSQEVAAQAIVRETGVPVFTLDSGVRGMPEIDAYIKAMERNLRTLQEALNR